MDYGRKEHDRWSQFDLLQPIITCPPGAQLERVGSPDPETDGGKWLCTPLDGLLPVSGPCVAYSFGSHMNFLFESAVLNLTRCSVYTYDCTVQGATLDPERHTFHRKCVGPRSMGRDFMTWDQALQANGHSDVHILKIDIEGSEWAALGSWTVDTPGLPTIIAIELHLRKDPVWERAEVSVSDLALFAQHLGTLGYALVSREPNPNHPPCSEFTFLRVEVPRRWSSSGQGRLAQGAAGGNGDRAAAAAALGGNGRGRDTDSSR